MPTKRDALTKREMKLLEERGLGQLPEGQKPTRPKPPKTKAGRVGFRARGRPSIAELASDPTAQELELFDWFCRGWSIQKLTVKFGGTWDGTSAVVQRCEQFLRQHWARDIVGLKTSQCEALNDLWYEARQAWEASQKDVVKTVTDEDGVTRTETTTSGDPRFLEAARAALADIRKIMGADAPLVVESVDLPRAAGKTQEAYRQELVAHVQSLCAVVVN